MIFNARYCTKKSIRNACLNRIFNDFLPNCVGLSGKAHSACKIGTHFKISVTALVT